MASSILLGVEVAAGDGSAKRAYRADAGYQSAIAAMVVIGDIELEPSTLVS